MSVNVNFYPKQWDFINTLTHNAAFVAGLGSGKSLAGAARALLASQGYIGQRQILRTPNLGIVTAPTHKMLKDATIRTFLEIAGAAVQRYYKSNDDLRALMVNGSEILFRSCSDPESLRGPNASWWWGDEAAMYSPVTRKIMITRLRQFGKLGYNWLTTTPRGRNWVWQTFIRDHVKNPDYFIVRASSRENIFLEDAILEAWEQEFVGDFAAQELDGQFVAYSGLVYGEFDRSLHVTTQQPQQWVGAAAGVDWGFANPGVIVVGTTDGDQRLHVAHEEYQRQRHIDEWVSVAKHLRDTWSIKTFYCDPSEPDYIKKFREAGLNAVAANNAVNTGIQAVKARLIRQQDKRPRLTINAECGHLIDEFEMYQWSENKAGLQDHPVKAHDHAMDALRYLTMGLGKPTTPKKAEFVPVQY